VTPERASSDEAAEPLNREAEEPLHRGESEDDGEGPVSSIPVAAECEASAKTRVYARFEERPSQLTKPQPFTVLEPAARTHIFPAPVPHLPEQRFSAGGTQIMAAPNLDEVARAPDSTTQHFSVEQLLSRRAQLEPQADPPPQLEPEPDPQLLEVPKTPSRLWLRASMLCLLLASAGMLLWEPSASSSGAAPRSAASGLASAAAHKGASGAVAPTPLPVVSSDPRVTLQRTAADVVAEGRYQEALAIYRKLAASEPDTRAYTEIVQILEHRLAARKGK
jgi:hypothetical protein